MMASAGYAGIKMLYISIITTHAALEAGLAENVFVVYYVVIAILQ